TAGTDVSVESTDPTLPGHPTTSQDASVLRGTLNFVFQQLLWPNIEIQTGGQFERDWRKLESDETGVQRFTFTRLPPFALLRWRPPVYLGEASWQRFEDSQEGEGLTRKLTRDATGGTLGWYPTGTDFIRLSYVHTDDRDEDRRL